MNGSENTVFRRLIETRIATLDEEDRLGKDGQDVVVLDQQAVGRLSRQDALLSQSMAKATQARRDGQRRALLAALDRIERGEFGFCDDCGEEIAPKRLELDPTAMLCVSCAAAR
ncbi:TraR/DksA C4-type zinc finger protein [Thalassococcus sp. CAU 1522]|uniref:TraR/DksA C4-type zinc finger protein n=1 Tax=Thalassococcus arenae TaxID=2851652 RepID=A0ABS6NC02_9RHOB|nr:TraR/DksA C4-type zinc finger protein [Thalassococcus arenae]MBV2361318.1 TraR/DksA C4-type zinc finger protein [Thalassococcus arenae]